MIKIANILGALLIISINVAAQQVEVMKFFELSRYIEKSDPGKISVYNFWATWCKPCIVEMPHFEKLAGEYDDQLDLTFVSLDFADNLEKKVKPFLTKRGITAKVILLDDTDYNSWIDKVDPSWSGAIPATLIIDQDGTKHFFEQEFDYEELKNTIEELINR